MTSWIRNVGFIFSNIPGLKKIHIAGNEVELVLPFAPNIQHIGEL